jgi:flagellar operon protein
VIATIDRIAGQAVWPPGSPTIPPDPATRASPLPDSSRGSSSFADELAAAGRESSVNLSGHALRRLEQRQIDLQGDQLERLGRAIDSLAARGGRQSLVMLDQVAYVVHVPSHTVVTAVAPDDRKESVFTQIDSVAIA